MRRLQPAAVSANRRGNAGAATPKLPLPRQRFASRSPAISPQLFSLRDRCGVMTRGVLFHPASLLQHSPHEPLSNFGAIKGFLPQWSAVGSHGRFRQRSLTSHVLTLLSVGGRSWRLPSPWVGGGGFRATFLLAPGFPQLFFAPQTLRRCL